MSPSFECWQVSNFGWNWNFFLNETKARWVKESIHGSFDWDFLCLSSCLSILSISRPHALSLTDLTLLEPSFWRILMLRLGEEMLIFLWMWVALVLTDATEKFGCFTPKKRYDFTDQGSLGKSIQPTTRLMQAASWTSPLALKVPLLMRLMRLMSWFFKQKSLVILLLAVGWRFHESAPYHLASWAEWARHYAGQGARVVKRRRTQWTLGYDRFGLL